MVGGSRKDIQPLPAGPSTIDMVANSALFLGATYFLATKKIPPESGIPFKDIKDNFYNAARYGLDGKINWFGEKKIPISKVLKEEIIPMQITGLKALKINENSINRLTEIIKARIDTQQTGSRWQRDFLRKNGNDFTKMTKEYYRLQEEGKPVHEWSV